MAQAYEVVDSRTAKVVATTNSSVEAYDTADRMDRAFGAVRYAVRRDYEAMSTEEFAVFMDRVPADRVSA